MSGPAPLPRIGKFTGKKMTQAGGKTVGPRTGGGTMREAPVSAKSTPRVRPANVNRPPRGLISR